MSFFDPNISYYIYVPGWIILMITYIATAEYSTFVSKFLLESNYKFKYRLINFISSTWHFLIISSICLFFWHIYPQFKLLKLIFFIIIFSQWVAASINTLFLWISDFSPLKNKYYTFYMWLLWFTYLWYVLMVNQMLAIFVFNTPIVYVILTNESLFLIILNWILKTRFQQDNGVIFIEITSVCLACLSILKPNEYFPSISAPLWFLMFLFHTACIAVMHFQRSYGSRFFLPRKFRNKVYEKYLVTVSSDLRQDTFLQWIIWTNSVNGKFSIMPLLINYKRQSKILIGFIFSYSN